MCPYNLYIINKHEVMKKNHITTVTTNSSLRQGQGGKHVADISLNTDTFIEIKTSHKGTDIRSVLVRLTRQSGN